MLAVIPARGGSKGLPRKNVLPAGGMPLVAWSIQAARQAKCIDNVVVSSDDDEILDVATQWGCPKPLRRPDVLASDTATSIDVVLHALDQMQGYDYVVLLQPTSPLRTAADIDEAFRLVQTHGAASCVSVCEAQQSPYLMYHVGKTGELSSVMPGGPFTGRRQDLPAAYVLNGAIYVAEVNWLRKGKRFIDATTIAYPMPNERSLDIDTASDFEAFRSIVER